MDMDIAAVDIKDTEGMEVIEAEEDRVRCEQRIGDIEAEDMEGEDMEEEDMEEEDTEGEVTVVVADPLIMILMHHMGGMMINGDISKAVVIIMMRDIKMDIDHKYCFNVSLFECVCSSHIHCFQFRISMSLSKSNTQ